MSEHATTTAIVHPTGCYRRQVGDIRLTALHDGQFEAAFGDVVGVDAGAAEALERGAFRRVPPRITVNAFLIESDGRRAMIDTGCGAAFGPHMGRAIVHLEACGITPEMVDTILLTHGHIDDVSGLTDSAGVAVFPDAEVRWSMREEAHWFDDAAMQSASDEAKQGFEVARRALAPYAGRIRAFTEGEVFPGVTAMPLPGHTPGHTGYLVQSGGERLLVWGDVVHLPGIQFADPRAGMVFDTDSEAARRTRMEILASAESDRFAIAGIHLDFPTFGHVIRAGEGYGFVPEVWSTLP